MTAYRHSAFSGAFSAAFVATLAATVVLGGCQDSTSTGALATSIAATPGFVPGVPPGYTCPLVPNGFDPAGSIYRLDATNTYYRVKDFSKDPAVLAMNGYRRDVAISNYVLNDKQTSTVGLSYEILKNALPGLTASGSGDFKKEVAVNITVEDMKGEVIDDTVADHIVDWFEKNIKPKPGNRYFIVRETVRAGAVSYSLKQDDIAKLGGKAQIEKLADAKADVTFKDNNGLFEIKQTFTPERIPVCIKSAELLVMKPSPSSGQNVSLRSAEETSVPAIKKIGETATP